MGVISRTVAVSAVTLAAAATSAQTISADLAGEPLSKYPDFTAVNAFNADSPIHVGIDPARYPGIAGATADLYLVAHRANWRTGDVLVDAGNGAETITFSGRTLGSNVFEAAAANELSADAGTDFGMPYDVIVDVDRSGTLSDGDLIDGGADEAGLHVVADLVSGGPLATTYVDYTVADVNPVYAQQRTWYPVGIETMGELPLVIVSHGNGHGHTWYDYLQEHLASWGYVVMSHQNETRPGVESASTTTLEHTDAFIGQLDQMAGGLLSTHVDTSRITWIGHSRGGEGAVRAYDRLVDGDFVPSHYDLADIALISAIAPTDFLGPGNATPHEENFHLLYGSADGDVCGCPGIESAASFHLLERATGFRQSTYVHGADHNDFNCCGFEDFTGPPETEIGRDEAQRVAKSTYVALLKHYIEGSVPAGEYLWRQYESFRPPGVAASTVVVSEYRSGEDRFVVDDYESEPDAGISSSGGAVTFDVKALAEGRMDDGDDEFTWMPDDSFNGMTRAQAEDPVNGVVFTVPAEGQQVSRMIWTLPAGTDVTSYGYLSFRAAQGTRHPATESELGDYSFFVMLADGSGRRSFIDFGAYGGGVEEPYQRMDYGQGAGWQNEFETIRIPLADFLASRGRALPPVNLRDVTQVGFFFVNPGGSREARLALDDLEFTR